MIFHSLDHIYEPINIIMVSYHRPNDLYKSISSILSFTTFPYSLTIIDNSCGGVDHIFNSFNNISIIKNSHNIGKGRSIMTHYHEIMCHNNSNYVITIDGDVIVGRHWLERFIEASKKLNDWSILAPTIKHCHDDWFNKQLIHGFNMHNTSDLTHYKDEIYYNSRLAGPLFFINRAFFDINGYSTDFIYGGDDGYLCRLAVEQRKFLGMLSNVHITHSRLDESTGYIDWKRKNIENINQKKGYWDQ